MNSKVKDLFRKLEDQQIESMGRQVQTGIALTDAQQQAIAIHALALQVGEVASALGRIYMTLETKKGDQ